MEKIHAKDNSSKRDYPKASNGVVFGTVVTFAGSTALLLSLCSPYWLVSYEESNSSFLNMGLWQYCFKQFVYPYYQISKKFTGCHNIFSHEYYVIREWLLPGWLMTVQALVAIAFVSTYASLGILSLVIIRVPLKGVLQHEWILTKISFVCCAVASTFMFLAVAIFGGSAYRRDWLMYPKFNVLSWSYSLAVLSFIILGVAALILYREAKEAFDVREKNKSLVIQMEMLEPGFLAPRQSRSQPRYV